MIIITLNGLLYIKTPIISLRNEFKFIPSEKTMLFEYNSMLMKLLLIYNNFRKLKIMLRLNCV
jgi:hypothetical protein